MATMTLSSALTKAGAAMTDAATEVVRLTKYIAGYLTDD